MLKPYEYDGKAECDFYDISVYGRSGFGVEYDDNWITDGALVIKHNHFPNITFDYNDYVKFDLLEKEVKTVFEWSNINDAKTAGIAGLYEDNSSDLKLLVLTTEDGRVGCFNPVPFPALLQYDFELKMSFHKDTPIVSLWNGEDFVALLSGMFLFERVKEEIKYELENDEC